MICASVKVPQPETSPRIPPRGTPISSLSTFVTRPPSLLHLTPRQPLPLSSQPVPHGSLEAAHDLPRARAAYGYAVIRMGNDAIVRVMMR